MSWAGCGQGVPEETHAVIQFCCPRRVFHWVSTKGQVCVRPSGKHHDSHFRVKETTLILQKMQWRTPKPYHWQSRIYFELRSVKKPQCAVTFLSGAEVSCRPLSFQLTTTLHTGPRLLTSSTTGQNTPRPQTLHPAHHSAWSSLPSSGPGIQKNIVETNPPATHTNYFYMNSWWYTFLPHLECV